MEILGVGWQELIFIFIIALIVLGPKDMQKAGKTIGRWLNQFVNSDTWKVFQQTSSELRNLPRNLMKEANMEMQETERELRRTLDQIDAPDQRPSRSVASSTLPASSHVRGLPPSDETENTIQPPAASPAQAAVPDGESSAEDGAGSRTSVGSSDGAGSRDGVGNKDSSGSNDTSESKASMGSNVNAENTEDHD